MHSCKFPHVRGQISQEGASLTETWVRHSGLYSVLTMRACMPSGWEHMREEVVEDCQKEGRFCFYCSSYGSVCIHRSHVVTCARVQQGWFSQSSFWLPARPDSRNRLQDSIRNVFNARGAGTVAVESGCGGHVPVGCDLVLCMWYTCRYLSNRNPQEIAQAHVTFVCEVKSQSATRSRHHTKSSEATRVHCIQCRHVWALELRRHLELNRNLARVCSRRESTRDETGFLFRWFKSLRGLYTENSSVDNPRLCLR